MSNTDLEVKLIKLGKWAIRINQIIGYLPISIAKNNNGVQSLKSGSSCIPSILYTLLILFITIAWEINFFKNIQSYQKFVAVYGPTEKKVHAFYIFAGSVLGFSYRAYGFFNGAATIKFWNENCRVFENVQHTLGYYKLEMLDTQYFQDIQSSIRFSIIMNVISIVLHVLIVHGYRVYGTLSDDTGWSTDSDYHVGSGFWFGAAMFHIMHSNWLIFFIRLYTSSYRCISSKIREIRATLDFEYSKELSCIMGTNSAPIGLQLSKTREILLNRYIKAFNMIDTLVDSFNSFFGGKLMIEMLVTIINLLINSFFMSLWIGRNVWRQAAMNLVPLSVFAIHIYRLGSVGGELTRSAQDVASAFYEISTDNISLCSNLRFQIHLLSNRLFSCPPVITGRRFIIVNRRLVTSIISAIATFLVVLVQFRDAESSEFMAIPVSVNATKGSPLLST